VSYTVSDFGRLEGVENMKLEIYRRGPIACGIAATEAMDLYEGGVFYQPLEGKAEEVRINHVVSVVGWGEDEGGLEYWIVRNSWGTAWGENGYMKIR
jgi:cathepsin X